MIAPRTTLYRAGSILSRGDGAAESMLVGEGRIRWLGPDSEADRHVDGADEVVHLDGALVTPAFVDAHAHLSQTGAGMRGVDLSDVRSLAEALGRIESAARAVAGRAVFAPNWDETGWPERRPFTAAELDRATYGGVVYAPRVDGHSAVVSSALAAAARIRDADGRLPDGLVITDAHHQARDTFASSVPPAQRRDDIAAALRAASEAGIAVVHENGGPVVSSAEDFADVLDVARRPGLPDVVGYWAELAESAQAARELVRRHGAHGLAGDLSADGSIGSRTASLRAPYADLPTDPDHCGNAYLSMAQVCRHLEACTAAGVQGGFHVIGDRGVATVLEGMEAAAAVTGLDAFRRTGHRLEHVEMLGGGEVRRLARLGVMASVQPAFDAAWGGPAGMYAERLGVERVSGMNPFRTMLDAGLVLALGSDSPVTPFAPWEAVRACVRHHAHAERLSPTAAFRAHTVGGHRAAGARGGELREGAEATFVVWDRRGPGLPDLADGQPAPQAVTTVLRGGVLHHAP